jgi:predicted dehydrogenase
MRPIRLALFGGGPGAFIGAVHRRAASLDQRFALVAGAFSRDRDRSRSQGQAWGVAEDRIHTDADALFAAEALRPDGIEAVAIATPNASHFPIAAAALRAGLHVMSDKPMTTTLADARALAGIAAAAPGVYGLSFTYAGYPMIREARARVAAGEIGAVRKIAVDYPQGWLAWPVEADNRQAAWRTDPAQSGIGGCIADIGVHAFHLAEHVSGLRVTELCADLACVVPGRQLDDDCNLLLRFGAVPGVLSASQIATGERNGLRLRVHGADGTIAWDHDRCGELRILRADGAMTTLYAGTGNLGDAARAASRIPAGHPEGFIEAFANLYGDFAEAIGGATAHALPGIADGLRSMAFIETAVASDQARRWLPLEQP